MLTLDRLSDCLRAPWGIVSIVVMCGHQVIFNGQQEQDAGRGGHEGVREDHTPMC